MNRIDLQILSGKRIAEAQALISAGFNEGAYYLAGYAIECAFKACIARRTQLHDFPDKKLVNQVFTHNLATLLRISGLETELEKEVQSNPELGDNWEVVKDWSEEARYLSAIAPKTARNFHDAVMDPRSGVLTWLKKFW